jgi:hypothetical protein
LISGVEDDQVRFWFVRNSQGLHDHDWTYKPPRSEFQAVNDLDDNYMPRDLRPGQTKEQLLQTRLYSFRQGALLPAAPVFDAFGVILRTIYAHGVEGFEPVASLDDLAYYARQRMEFLKRLYSPDARACSSAQVSAPVRLQISPGSGVIDKNNST